MAGFQDIVGHNKIINHLKNAIQMDKVSHAYIINGEENSGNKMIAEAFAMALQCEENGENPCGNCRSCRQAVDRNQPDIIYIGEDDVLEDKKTKSISVDVNLCWPIPMPPSSGRLATQSKAICALPWTVSAARVWTS